MKTGHPSASGRATRTSSGLRAVSFVAVILALGLKVPLYRGEDNATMCAPPISHHPVSCATDFPVALRRLLRVLRH